METLTQLQRQVFDFISYRLNEGNPPTFRELADAFGWRSKRAAECHVEALIRKGWLASASGKARSLRPTSNASTTLLTQRQPVIDIPILGAIPAGFGEEREQTPGECVPVTLDTLGFKPSRNTFALRVSGDSMVGKHICDGDIAILEHGPTPRTGQVVAALIDRKNTLKTFVIKNGKPFLKAENPKYPDLIPSEELVIQGVLRAVLRRFEK